MALRATHPPTPPLANVQTSLRRTLAELGDELVRPWPWLALRTNSAPRFRALQAAGFNIDAAPAERVGVEARPQTARVGGHQRFSDRILALAMGRECSPLDGTILARHSPVEQNAQSLPEAVWKHYAKRREQVIVRGATPSRTPKARNPGNAQSASQHRWWRSTTLRRPRPRRGRSNRCARPVPRESLCHRRGCCR